MGGEDRKLRVAWVGLQPAPYVLPLFRALAEQPGLEIRYFFSNTEGEQPWRLGTYESIIDPACFGRTLRLGPCVLNAGVVRALWRESWDAVVIAGYSSPTQQATIVQCLLRRIPFILQGDTTLLLPRSWPKRAAKRVFLFPVLRRCRAAIGLGIENQRYWQHVGVPADRTFIVPFTPHLDCFRMEPTVRAERRSLVRGQLGVSDEAMLGVFVGRLVNYKAVDVLLEGMARVAPARRPHLLLIGEGPERLKLERIAKQHGLPVTFLGFRQNQELAEFYAAADFFVLPSCIEMWGVVVAEAMASSLPVVLSDQVGAASDLLRDNHNGFLVPGGTVEAWAEALHRCIDSRAQLKQMGENSRVMISDWTCERSVRQFLTALTTAVGRSPGSED